MIELVEKLVKIDMPDEKRYSREIFRSYDHNIVVTLSGDGEIWFYIYDDSDIVEQRRILKLDVVKP